jgi:hypothetical protein
MPAKSYTRQLELHIEELQEQLAISQKLVEDSHKHHRFVVVCKDPNDVDIAINTTAELVVFKVKMSGLTLSPKPPHPHVSIYQSIKDRCNPCGSFYDIDMLKAYAHGCHVIPYKCKK